MGISFKNVLPGFSHSQKGTQPVIENLSVMIAFLWVTMKLIYTLFNSSLTMRITLSHIITRPEFVLLTDIYCLVETREVGMCFFIAYPVRAWACGSSAHHSLWAGCEQALTDILTHMAAHTFPSLPPGCHPHTPMKTLLPANHLRHNGACSTTATSLLTPPYSFHPFAPFHWFMRCYTCPHLTWSQCTPQPTKR